LLSHTSDGARVARLAHRAVLPAFAAFFGSGTRVAQPLCGPLIAGDRVQTTNLKEAYMRKGTWAALVAAASLAGGLAACDQAGTPEQPRTTQPPRQEQPSQPGGSSSQPGQPGSPPSGGSTR